MCVGKCFLAQPDISVWKRTVALQRCSTAAALENNFILCYLTENNVLCSIALVEGGMLNFSSSTRLKNCILCCMYPKNLFSLVNDDISVYNVDIIMH